MPEEESRGLLTEPKQIVTLNGRVLSVLPWDPNQEMSLDNCTNV